MSKTQYSQEFIVCSDECSFKSVVDTVMYVEGEKSGWRFEYFVLEMDLLMKMQSKYINFIIGK